MTRALILGLLLSASAVSAQQPADGQPAAIMKSRCAVCHETDIITSQKLSLAAWTREIDKMVRWGSAITPQEREVLQPYLAEHAGLGAAVSHVTAGEATYKRACLTCHDGNMVEQQHLSKPAWTREVEKMVRWGAPVTDADKGALADYLAARFPAR